MLETVIVDLTSEDPTGSLDLDPRELRLFPFLYLIAEKVIETGGFYKVQDQEDRSFVQSAFLIPQGRPSFIDVIRNDHAPMFSACKHHKRQALAFTGLAAENAILILCAAGLHIQIPNFTINLARSAEIEDVRNKLAEERTDYRKAIARLADECYDRLANNIYGDTVDWALNEAHFKIRPKVEEFQRAMAKVDRNVVDRIGLTLVKEGIPVIASSLASEGIRGAGKQFIEVMLQVLCTNLARSIEERRMPEVVYGFKIAKEMRQDLPK